MALGTDYANQVCTMARSLEVVGERWTLLIVRATFYGVHRFNDLATRVGAPRAVLADRLTKLVDEGVLQRDSDGHASGYELTEKGRLLWPVIESLTAWGDSYYAPEGQPRELFHDIDDGTIGPDGRCETCGLQPAPENLRLIPGTLTKSPREQ
jgi:DNA-binding HxlR family transcriptional regulator